MPHSACGPCRLALNSNDWTAPKLPPPAAPQGPEQMGIFLLAGEAKLAVGGHDVDRHQVVRRVAELARGPAEAAAHGETRDAGIGHDPARNHQTERLRLVIDVAPGAAAF